MPPRIQPPALPMPPPSSPHRLTRCPAHLRLLLLFLSLLLHYPSQLPGGLQRPKGAKGEKKEPVSAVALTARQLCGFPINKKALLPSLSYPSEAQKLTRALARASSRPFPSIGSFALPCPVFLLALLHRPVDSSHGIIAMSPSWSCLISMSATPSAPRGWGCRRSEAPSSCPA